MSRKIFFSYSWKDNVTAMRIYADLVRSHLQVWRDQTDGEPTAAFVDEFKSKIDECDDFLMLDSQNYRHKSNWCLTEIKRFFENRRRKEDRRIIVCLLEPDGPWRKHYESEEQETLYSQINEYRHFDFFREGTYDNSDVYWQAMNAVCALFSERFIPWNTAPIVKDLEDELESKTDIDITDDDRNNVIRGYDYIYRLISLNWDVKEHFNTWVKDCEHYGLNLFTPRFAMCSWLASDANNGRWYEESFLQFEKLADKFPDNPRCQYGLGAIASRLGKHKVAIEAYKKALNLLNLKANEWIRQHRLLDVLVDLGVVLINDDEYAEAIGYLKLAYDEMLTCKRLDIQLVKHLRYCFKVMNNMKECRDMLLSLLEQYSIENELLAQYGLVCMHMNDYDEAQRYCDMAYSLAPSVENGLYVILCRKHLNHGTLSPEIREFALSLLDRLDCPDDGYWKAGICLLAFDDEEKAKQYVPDWEFPKYKKHITDLLI